MCDAAPHPWDALPKEISDVIVGLVVSADDRAIVEDIKRLVPHVAGSTENPFFSETEQLPLVVDLPTRVRTADGRLPRLLLPLYESYAEDVEFRNGNGLVFLSERELRSRANGEFVDIAYRYVGMGHVVVHAYVPDDGVVVSHLDGGSEYHSRAINHDTRRRFVRSVIEWLRRTDAAVPAPAEDDEWRRVRPFSEWWQTEVRNGVWSP